MSLKTIFIKLIFDDILSINVMTDDMGLVILFGFIIMQ